MNSKPVETLPEVANDLWQGEAHYSAWRSDGGEYFHQIFLETVGWIAWNPDAFPRKYGQVQRAILKHSFYIVYFIQEADRSLVLAVLDGRRAPEEIRGIVEQRKLVPLN